MELEICEVSKLKTNWSPEILIHGIPWKVRIIKMREGEVQSLAVHLFCASKDESPNWSLWGMASFKLLPVTDDANTIEYHTPQYAFDASGTGLGTSSFIKWNDLFAQDNKYVKDDTINLEITVSAENPNDPNRSCVNFECLHKGCDNSNYAKLKVTNVLNLVTVKSPIFMLRGLPWQIQISKTCESHLGVQLLLIKDSGKEPTKITMSIKLVSSKANVHPIKKCITNQYKLSTVTPTKPIVSWDELIKPQNGFVNNDSITLSIKIDSDANDMPIAKRAKLNLQNEIKSPQMECPICFKCIADQDLSVTSCGHLFCLECITKAIRNRAVCPTCNKATRLKTLRRLFLPV